MRTLLLCALACGCPSELPANSHWPAPAVPAYVHQARFAVTDNLSDALSFVDPVQPVLLGNAPIGDVPVEVEGPHHLAASPDGKYIYYNLSNYVPGTGSGPHGAYGTGTVARLAGQARRHDDGEGRRGAPRSQPRRHDPLGRRQVRVRHAL